jgi:paired amphipathic helix protein Sin3a
MPSSLAHGYLNGSNLSTQEELMFFDRTKKALESEGTYEEFLKLLNLFAKDVIDTRTLIKRSETFLTESDLLYQFKELMGWDDKRGNIEYGPPGSIRTHAPDPNAAISLDDDDGPSYRKLPVYVRISFF